MNKSLFADILTQISRVVALQLWEVGAIKINVETPFQLTSGNYSPLYINCRELIGAPNFVRFFCAAVAILCEAQNVAFEVVAGGETAGIPFAAFLALTLGRPMVYVRKDVKFHGLNSRIEGQSVSGARVLLVEDLITDAGSKLNFIDAIRQAGGRVNDVAVVFDRQQGGEKVLEERGVRLHTLTTLAISLDVAREKGLITVEELDVVHKYLDSARDWHAERGLVFNG